MGYKVTYATDQDTISWTMYEDATGVQTDENLNLYVIRGTDIVALYHPMIWIHAEEEK